MKVWKDTEYFHQYNANPKNKDTSDCVIRAITVLTGKDWDTVFDELVPYAHKHKCLINNDSAYENYLKDIGYVRMKQPKHADNTKYTGSDLVMFMRKNGFVRPVMMSIGAHHVSVIARPFDGTDRSHTSPPKILDTANISLRKVGKVWVSKEDADFWVTRMAMTKWDEDE